MQTPLTKYTINNSTLKNELIIFISLDPLAIVPSNKHSYYYMAIINLFCYFFNVYIESQFDRCLDQLFGIVLSPADDAKLMEKYGSADPKRKGMVSYRRFCEVIGAGMF